MSAYMKFSEGTGEPARRLSVNSWPTWAMASESGPWRSCSSVTSLGLLSAMDASSLRRVS